MRFGYTRGLQPPCTSLTSLHSPLPTHPPALLCLPHCHAPLQAPLQAVNERDEVLAAKRADKVLQCDLTAEEEPEWRAVKKTVHSVA